MKTKEEFNPEEPAKTLDELVELIKMIGFYPEEINLLIDIVNNNKTRDEFTKKLKN